MENFFNAYLSSINENPFKVQGISGQFFSFTFVPETLSTEP